MDEHKQSEDFLNAATAGLKNDPELRLDVQAELRSHLEEHQREAEVKGLVPDAATDEAVRAMGQPAELAASLESANRHRMRLRSLIKITAQWLFAPLAIAIAVLTTEWGTFQAIRAIGALDGSECFIGADINTVRRKLTPEQRLVLYGDPTRKTTYEKQKAVWEKWPDNKVYLHNYVSCLISGDGIGMEIARYPELTAEIAKLKPMDPDNARFDYILAGRLLDQAVDFKSSSEKGPDGKLKTVYNSTVKDRAKLDEAMAHLKAGLAKPEFWRYTREMAVERLAIMGEPTSLFQEISEITMLAGILLPDLSHLRNLERASLFYGELLANEGKRKEADIFLNAHRRLVPQLNGEAFTLIDVLVVTAIAGIAGERLPEIYEKLGEPVAAEKAKDETAALTMPVKQWKEKNKITNTPTGQDFKRNLKRHGGILAGTLIPGLGEYPSSDELAPSRQLDYVVAEGVGLAVLSIGLILMMTALAIFAIHYRWICGGGTNVLLLLPSGGDLLRILGFGVLMPILLYYGITRCLPWTGRDLSLPYGFPQFIAQYLAVLCAILTGTNMLSDNCVRRRCRELLLPVPPFTRNLYIIGWVTAGSFAALAMLPQSWLDRERSYVQTLGAVVAVGLLLLILTGLVHYACRDLRYARKFAAYYGSLSRTMIPVVALTLIIVNISSRPYLRMAERNLLAKDTVLGVDSNAGFTIIESRVTQRLKGEIQKAAEALPPYR